MEYFVMGKSLEHVESYTITGGLKSRMAPYQRRTTKDILLAELHIFHSFQPHQSDILFLYGKYPELGQERLNFVFI